MAGIPVPPPLQLPPKDTSANMSGLFSGVTFNCSIFVDTGRGLFSESQLRYLTLRTPETAPSGSPATFNNIEGKREV
ncbi:hypothetical protein GBAR_LOCUS26395, partial [Geodia barretti]